MADLVKRRAGVFVEDVNVRDVLTLDAAPIVFMHLPLSSGYTRFQGWPGHDVYYLWLFQNDANAEQLARILKGEDQSGTIPLFDPGMAIQGRDAITSVFKRGKASKGLIGAVRYLVLDNDIYIDFMAVRDAWKRKGINSAMMRTLLSRYPGRALSFSSPTREGRAFIEATSMGPIANVKR